MKKFISTLLLVGMCSSLLAGCGSTLKEDEKGATVNLYIANEVIDFDPALAYTDDSAVKVLGLVYEGLTKIGANGKVENALMKSYKVFENEDKGEYRMEITLKQTKWSDGRLVSADDIVYAWKRILDPEFSCAAAALLFDIKNARDVKMGDNSIDDLGIAAIDTDVLEVKFETKINYEQFLENCASLALVPLREDVVTRYDSFGTASTTMCSNGAFAVKGFEEGERLMLERNVYYYRDTDKDEALDKYVLPYRLVVNYDADVEENTLAYENGEIFYLGEIALAKRADYAKKANVSSLLSTHSYIFNTDNDMCDDAEVRRGLSTALDRKAIADIVTFADPATGLVPGSVYDAKVGDSFRKNGGALISTDADVDAAKELIGKVKGKFTITCRDLEVEVAIAEYCMGVWSDLGYRVDVDALDADDYAEAYASGDYDVIAVDYQSLSTDAFGTLAVFAPMFSGMGIDIQNDNYDAVPFIPGYDNEAYNELIEAAFAEKDRAARSKILHEAEKLLMEDMAIMPLVFNEDAYLYNGKVLSGVKDCYYGFRDLDRLNMKKWRSYETSEK